MLLKVIVMVWCVASVLTRADSPPPYYGRSQDSSSGSMEDMGPARYDFSWGVKHDYTGNDFSHQESRDDDHTQGSYTVQLPDGRLQTVTYYVDGDSGYVAEVSYQGEAQYPESAESRSAPVYSPPPRYSAPAPQVPVYTPPRTSYSFPQ